MQGPKLMLLVDAKVSIIFCCLEVLVLMFQFRMLKMKLKMNTGSPHLLASEEG